MENIFRRVVSGVGHIERDMNDMKGQSRESPKQEVILVEINTFGPVLLEKWQETLGIQRCGQLSKVREMGKGMIILEMQVSINKMDFNFNLKALGGFQQDSNLTEYYEMMITLVVNTGSNHIQYQELKQGYQLGNCVSGPGRR